MEAIGAFFFSSSVLVGEKLLSSLFLLYGGIGVDVIGDATTTFSFLRSMARSEVID